MSSSPMSTDPTGSTPSEWSPPTVIFELFYDEVMEGPIESKPLVETAPSGHLYFEITDAEHLRKYGTPGLEMRVLARLLTPESRPAGYDEYVYRVPRG
jgi:hypothetical protein